MQTTGRVTKVDTSHGTGAVIGVDPDDSADVKNMANISFSTVDGNPDNFAVGDLVTISLTKS